MNATTTPARRQRKPAERFCKLRAIPSLKLWELEKGQGLLQERCCLLHALLRQADDVRTSPQMGERACRTVGILQGASEGQPVQP